MITFRVFLESLDSDVTFEVVKDTPYEYLAWCTIDGHHVEFFAEQNSDGDPWTIDFTVNGSFERENVGADTARKILAFVFKRTQELLIKRDVILVSFEAKATDLSRLKIYRRLISKFKQYRLVDSRVDSKYREFLLKRKEF